MAEIRQGINGMDCLELVHQSGARLVIYLQGAHATAWRDAHGNDILFMSEKSSFKSGHPIRGGIPVVFPQFGDGLLPKHGFARINQWKYLGADSSDACAMSAFELTDSEETRRLWPHTFRVEMEFRLRSEELEIVFTVENTGAEAFEFQNGLHTYFAVGDISGVSVSGLHGAEYVDFLRDAAKRRDIRPAVVFDRETDRVYPYAPDELVIRGAASGRAIKIVKHNMNDVVIWNPWIEKARRMPDFGDDEYKRMVCVETGNLHAPLVLPKGAIHTSAALFRIEGVRQAPC